MWLWQRMLCWLGCILYIGTALAPGHTSIINSDWVVMSLAFLQ